MVNGTSHVYGKRGDALSILNILRSATLPLLRKSSMKFDIST